jgi:hypothetical protein
VSHYGIWWLKMIFSPSRLIILLGFPEKSAHSIPNLRRLLISFLLARYVVVEL